MTGEGWTAEQKRDVAAIGLKFMGMLAGGPERWEKLPTTIKPELVGSYIELMARHEPAGDTCMIQNIKLICTTAVTLLTDAMAEWAVANGREDLLEPLTARVERTILSEEP